MPETSLTYLQGGQRGVFAEVYFPRRVAAQGVIFSALQEGYQEETVIEYLQAHVDVLLQELPQHLQIFESHRQNISPGEKQKMTREEALKRIAEYKSPFFGWSNYVVDGVFWGKDGKMIEEATQIIRLMFNFESSYAAEATDAGCQDVLRAMLFWMINRSVRLTEITRWDESEFTRFVKEYEPFTESKMVFAEKYFEPVAHEVYQWIVDWFLFIFGYLVRQFSEELAKRGQPEQEIWVTLFTNLIVSVMKKVEQRS
jgi:hypothetical protein